MGVLEYLGDGNGRSVDRVTAVEGDGWAVLFLETAIGIFGYIFNTSIYF